MNARYRATLWRKAMERKGWRRISSISLPRCVIEFHIIQHGKLYSGRWHGKSFDPMDALTPGTAAHLITRRDLMTEGVWRRANDQSAEWGVVYRPF
ncbi:hypothetical protein [Vreelandella venusta]|uniref:hypothetical protein n=1 Tax=Vreelandella venusta TaxID=44935 RepID=UPI0018DA3912|nr:hypothetical protein [Halomonas venusta]QPI64476.1 hypothetical protein IR195_01735 [Halomonas venusta]